MFLLSVRFVSFKNKGSVLIMDFFIISGLSGAGKSRAAAVLEDMGFYCVDNMPPEFIPRFAEMCIAANSRFSHVALVTDIRAGLDFSALFDNKYYKSTGNPRKLVVFIHGSNSFILTHE